MYGSPSLFLSPSSSGAELPLCLLSAESTRGRQTTNIQSAAVEKTGAKRCSIQFLLTFSAKDKTVLAWMIATCSSFLKFCTKTPNLCLKKKNLFWSLIVKSACKLPRCLLVYPEVWWGLVCTHPRNKTHIKRKVIWCKNLFFFGQVSVQFK